MKHFRDSDDYNLSSEDMHEPTIKHFKEYSTGDVTSDPVNPLKKQLDDFQSQLTTYKKALELACEALSELTNRHVLNQYLSKGELDITEDYFLTEAKKGEIK